MGVRVSAAIVMAVFLVAGCGDAPDRPLRDGYTLQGVVLHAQTGSPVSEVDVLVGTEPDPEFHSYAVTDTAGGFTFLATIPTAPNAEVFRFEKPGYLSLDVEARTAARLEAYRYRLEVHLEQESTR